MSRPNPEISVSTSVIVAAAAAPTAAVENNSSDVYCTRTLKAEAEAAAAEFLYLYSLQGSDLATWGPRCQQGEWRIKWRDGSSCCPCTLILHADEHKLWGNMC
ncbi:hypothetical protein M0657_001658 [Pyricularia oryzae]|nr:hypothetical protein M9X92_001098 [Pyricularia oryzae]KAI7930538.1 hypothetical protein M0657_001658 [Pyricularia oryzae]